MKKLICIYCLLVSVAYGQDRPMKPPGAGSSFTPNFRFGSYEGFVMPWFFINGAWYMTYTANYVNAKFQPLLTYVPASQGDLQQEAQRAQQAEATKASINAVNSVSARRQGDSTALANEIIRAQLAENTKATKAYVALLHSRIVADSLRLVTEGATRQNTDNSKANTSQVAALDVRLVSDSGRLNSEVLRAKSIEAGLSIRIAADSSRTLTETSRATQAEALKIDRSEANAAFQLKGPYLTSYTETDPLSVPKTRLLNTGYGLTGGTSLNTDVTIKVDTLAMATKASLLSYVKGVKLAGGSSSFTTSNLLAGATTNVTVPLNTTFTDVNYQVTQPVVLSNGGLSLASSLVINSITKNTATVVVQLKNNSLLSVALSGTVELVAIKVN